MSHRTDQLMRFLGESDKKFGAGKVTIISDAKGIQMKRFSSGVFRMDEILGGGWPWGRMSLIHGPDRSGKSTLAQLACAQVQRLEAGTRLIAKDDGERCRALYVDQESVFEESWASSLGMDMDHHVLARPETGEEAIDLICASILTEEDEDPIFDLIVLDSLAACTPSRELGDKSGTAHPGLQARLINQAFRKWQPALTKLGPKAPAFLIINQQREKIGVMFGDPTTLPGGIAQMFYPSIRVRMSPPKMRDADDKLTAFTTLKARTVKNKTYTQELEAVFDLCVRDSEPFKKGEVLNEKDLFKAAKSLGLIGHTIDAGPLGVFKVSKDSEMIENMRDNFELYEYVRDKTLEKRFE